MRLGAESCPPDAYEFCCLLCLILLGLTLGALCEGLLMGLVVTVAVETYRLFTGAVGTLF